MQLEHILYKILDVNHRKLGFIEMFFNGTKDNIVQTCGSFEKNELTT